MHCDSEQTLLKFFEKFKTSHKNQANQRFILVEKPHADIGGGWIQDQDGVMREFGLPCCIFDDNQPEQVENFWKKVDAIANPDTKCFLNSMLMITMSFKHISRGWKCFKKVVSAKKFYAMCM